MAIECKAGKAANYPNTWHITEIITRFTSHTRDFWESVRVSSPTNVSSTVTQIEEVIAYIKKYVTKRTKFTIMLHRTQKQPE